MQSPERFSKRSSILSFTCRSKLGLFYSRRECRANRPWVHPTDRRKPVATRGRTIHRAGAEALDVHSSSNGDSAPSSYDLFQLKSQSFETSHHQCIGPFQRLVSKRHIGIPPDHFGQRQLDLQPG